MTIMNAFLQPVQLVTFSGLLSYNSNGFAVLPSYTVTPNIPISMQPLRQSDIQFLPEGTHYASYLWAISDYPILKDSTELNLGNYLIYNNNTVYKVVSDQNFRHFVYLPPNSSQTMVVKDNQLTYNGTSLNIPFPEIDGQYAPLFELIEMVNSCFTAPTITTMWAFQQELRPMYPYCAVSIDRVENIDNTNYVNNESLSSLPIVLNLTIPANSQVTIPPNFTVIGSASPSQNYATVSQYVFANNTASPVTGNYNITTYSNDTTTPVGIGTINNYLWSTITAINSVSNTVAASLNSNQGQVTNISKQLIVSFNFYALDMIQSLNLMEQFKLNYVNFTLTSPQFQWIGFVDDKFESDQNEIKKIMYEDRIVFQSTIKMRFTWIVQETATSNQSINTVAFNLSISP